MGHVDPRALAPGHAPRGRRDPEGGPGDLGPLGGAGLHGPDQPQPADGLRLRRLPRVHLPHHLSGARLARGGGTGRRAALGRRHPGRRGPSPRLRPRHVRSPGGDVPRRRRAGRAAVAQARLRPRGPPRRRPGTGPAARRGRAHRRQRPELPQPAPARPGRAGALPPVRRAGSTTPCAASPSTAPRRCGSGTGRRAPACRTPRRTTSSR